MKGVNTFLNGSNRLVALSSLKNDYYGVQKYQKWKFSKIRANLLTYHSTIRVGSLRAAFVSDLHTRFEEFIKAEPADMEKIITDFQVRGYNALLHNGTKATPFGNKIAELLNYDGFRNSTKGIWFGTQLNVKACLYCNAQYTLTLDKRKKALYQFDHYYSKKKYPYFSISMFNLVPACANCNTTKTSKEFRIATHAHPYIHDLNQLLEFDLDDTDVLNFIMSGKNAAHIKITVKNRVGIAAGTADQLRGTNHMTIFTLEDIYRLFGDVGEEIFLKAYYYTDQRKKELKDVFDAAGVQTAFTDSMMGRFILGNYTLNDEINKRPLSKMTKDIAEKLNLL